MTRALAFACTLAFTLPSSALAWGQNGHRVVGHLADERLDPAVAAKVKELLKGEDLAMVSTWADEVRSDPRYHHGSWHYTSVPDGEAYSDAERSGGEGKEDIVEALMLNLGILRDTERSAEERGIALRWICHLVGDLHQPLHVGRAKDRGGNSIHCTWAAEYGGEPELHGERVQKKVEKILERAKALEEDPTPQATAETLAQALEVLEAIARREVESGSNLHSIWDTHLIEMKQLAYRDYARFLLAKRGTKEEAGWAGFELDGARDAILAWTAESIELRPQAYEPPRNDRYGHYTYRDQKIDLVDQRLHQAGVRLARLLNVALAE
ncbi:MAG: S1/P1 nuclease [Planctomycetota bacterium]